MKKILCTIAMLLSLNAIAQKPELHVTFEGIGDNREYHSGLSRSQTIIGTLGSFEIGTRINQNSLYAGISELYEFGSSINSQRPRLIMYYKYEDPRTQFQFGSFPRLGNVDFPLAMLADTILYYRPQIEGLSGKLNGDWGHQMAFVDWTGRQTQTVRESFMIGSSGEVKVKNWFFQNYILMNHLAHTLGWVPDMHIKDHFGFSLLTGFHYGEESSLHGMLKGGLMTSLYRERSVISFQMKNSFYMEGTGQYRNFALKTTLHAGEGLKFAWGDPLYRLKNYLRTDAIWYLFNFKNVTARFNWSFHLIDWKSLDHSQQMFIVYRL